MMIGSTLPRQLNARARSLGVTLVKCPADLERESRARGYGAVLHHPKTHTLLHWRGDLTAGQRAHHVTHLLDLLEWEPKARELLLDPDFVLPSPIRLRATAA